MSLLDRVKGALHAVTGGAARVQFLFGPQILFPGEQVEIGVSAASTGLEVQSKGLFIDLSATELVDFRDGSGNLYVCCLDANIVARVTPTGVVSTFAQGLENVS